MKKYGFVDATFNKETGVSTTTILTDLGLFTGTAYLHEEDRDIMSEYEGCKYAEWRAIIKYYKALLKQKKAIYLNLQNIITNLNRMKDCNKDSREARFIRKQFYIARADYESLKDYISMLEENLYDMMKNYRGLRENYLKAIEKRRNKKSVLESI